MLLCTYMLTQTVMAYGMLYYLLNERIKYYPRNDTITNRMSNIEDNTNITQQHKY